MIKIKYHGIIYIGYVFTMGDQEFFICGKLKEPVCLKDVVVLEEL
jgi:hypothetical protein